MPEFGSDLLFVVLLVGAWVAQHLLRRRMADKRAATPVAADPKTTRVPDVLRTPTRGDDEVRPETPSRQPAPEAETPAESPTSEPVRSSAMPLHAGNIRQAIIMSEILGKPKSLR